jgi:tRNA-modifying protein YgfZ
MNDKPLDRVALLADYEALRRAAGFALIPRTQIEVRGADRASFLHGMCTNDVKSLAAGHGREAFFTNVQGKTIGHAYLFAGEEAIWIDATAGQEGVLMPALDRYIIREKVELFDRTVDRAELVVAGANVEAVLGGLAGAILPGVRLEHMSANVAGKAVSLRRVDFTGEACFFLACEVSDADAIRAALESAEARPVSDAVIEAARIEQGTPVFGRDITPTNLPQELARDRLAISFTKGCYLGQETVARIDALGHVNRYLVGVRFDGEVMPAVGATLRAGDKDVGHVTSAAYSPSLTAPLALAFVRRGHHESGTMLQADVAPGEVVALPIAREQP